MPLKKESKSIYQVESAQNPLNDYDIHPPPTELNSSRNVLLQRWLWHLITKGL